MSAMVHGGGGYLTKREAFCWTIVGLLVGLMASPLVIAAIVNLEFWLLAHFDPIMMLQVLS